MCQAYEGERNFIIAGEMRAEIKGFSAAKKGESQSTNPYDCCWSKYNHEAWDHGWRCWHRRILPYALEREYYKEGEYTRAREVRDNFKTTGELPSELERLLR